MGFVFNMPYILGHRIQPAVLHVLAASSQEDGTQRGAGGHQTKVVCVQESPSLPEIS